MFSLRWYHALGLAIACALLFAFLYAVRSVLPPFLIAFAIAWLLDPLLDRLEARGWPRVLAVAGVYLVFLAVFVVALVFLVPVVIDQSKQLTRDFPAYADRFKAFASQLMADNRDLLLRFHLPTTFQEVIARFGQNAEKDVSHALQVVTGWITANLSKVLWFILVPLIAFYLLNDIDRMRTKAVIFIPEEFRDKTTRVLSRIGTVFTNYVKGLLLVSLIYSVVTMTLLLALKLQYAVIIGLLAGILYAVPYVGAFVTILIVFLVGLATYSSGVSHAVATAVAQLVVNQTFDQLLTPRILGKSVGLHPVLSLFALLVGGHLFNLVGMILAVPVAASIQEIIFEFYPELRGPEKPKLGTRRGRKKGMRNEEKRAPAPEEPSSVEP